MDNMLGHLTPKNGTQSEIAKTIFCYLKSKNLDFEQLVVIGCDGTAINIRLKNDVIHNIEVKVGRPIQ